MIKAQFKTVFAQSQYPGIFAFLVPTHFAFIVIFSALFYDRHGQKHSYFIINAYNNNIQRVCSAFYKLFSICEVVYKMKPGVGKLFFN